MFAAVRIPLFPLTAQIRHLRDLSARPAAVLDTLAAAGGKNRCRILLGNEAAGACRVVPGMTAAQAQARCPELILLPRDPGREAAAQAELLACAAEFSPDFEDTAPGVITLDAFSLPSPPAQIAGGIMDCLAARGLPVRIGFAPHPDLAGLVSQVTDSVRILPDSPGEIAKFLQPLPLRTLAPPPQLLEILHAWGLRTLGDFTRLSRQDIAARLGPPGAALWDQAAGRHQRLLRLVRPPQDFRLDLDLEEEIQTLEPLLFVLKRFLDTLCARLECAYLCAGSLKLGLFHRQSPPYEKVLRIAVPCRDAGLLFRLLQAHLESYRAPEPIAAVGLELVPLPESRQQFHLFESSLRDPNQFSATLAEAEALLGCDRAGTPRTLSSHRPDAFSLAPCEEPAPPAVALPFALGLPLRRFRPPPPILVETEAGSAGERPRAIREGPVRGALESCRGPWLSSGEWWEADTAWSHREWDARLPDGACYRLRQTGARWFLEGQYA